MQGRMKNMLLLLAAGIALSVLLTILFDGAFFLFLPLIFAAWPCFGGKREP